MKKLIIIAVFVALFISGCVFDRSYWKGEYEEWQNTTFESPVPTPEADDTIYWGCNELFCF